MARNFHTINRRNRHYVIRMQVAVISAILLFILLFRFWPATSDPDRELTGDFSERELLDAEFIVTSQAVTVERSAPATPRVDETTPDEEIVDMEYDLELGDLTQNGGDPLSLFVDDRREPEVVENPDQPPRVRRIVEPVMPSQARQDGIRVEIEILFLVSAHGEVEEVSIAEIRMYNPASGRFEQVDATGYGFRDIVLRAARQWEFHPAEHEGETVRSRTHQQFRFGN